MDVILKFHINILFFFFILSVFNILFFNFQLPTFCEGKDTGYSAFGIKES